MSSPLYTQHFLLRDEYLGTIRRPKVLVHSVMQAPCGYAFFCPRCSTLWFVAPVEGEESMVHTMLCDEEEQTVLRGPSGSIWLEWDKDWQQALPAAVLKREAQLHLKYAHWCGLNTRVHQGELDVV